MAVARGGGRQTERKEKGQRWEREMQFRWLTSASYKRELFTDESNFISFARSEKGGMAGVFSETGDVQVHGWNQK